MAFTSLHDPAPVDGRTRTERDDLGALAIPADAYWGIHTARALANFPISGRPIAIYSDLLVGFACVKQAAARANAQIGVLDPALAALIDRACEEIRNGRLHDQFVVDIMQGGAGTSTNMNVNEVIANRALELGGYPRGAYGHLGPNDHVNRSQSTNDAYPTALRIGLRFAIERFVAETRRLEEAFRAKARAFAGIVKVGRTQLQDAVPMTVGQEFEAFAATISDDRRNLEQLLPELDEISLGATAIGTGITADPRFAEAVRAHLSEITGRTLRTAPDLVEATADTGALLDVSSALKRSAAKLSKICNDLRLLSSGPRAGLGELALPPRQAGSSLMPGKVNPVIPEVVNEVAFVVIGGDVTLTLAAEAGQLQLNAFGPVMAHVLFENLKWLTAAVGVLRTHCVEGIRANEEHLREQVASSVGVVTAFVPHIGYAAAARLAREALASGGCVAELAVASNLLTREQVTEILAHPAAVAHDRPQQSVRAPTAPDAGTARGLRRLGAQLHAAWREYELDHARYLAAAMVYYASVSLVPLLLLALSVLGLLLRFSTFASETRTRVLLGIESTFGAPIADALHQVLVGVSRGSVVATILGFVGLFFTASVLFLHLRLAFRAIWKLEPPLAAATVGGMVRQGLTERAIAFVMLLGGGGLLVAAVAVVGATYQINRLLGGGSLLVEGGGWVLTALNSYGFAAATFFALLKVLPPVPVPWRDAGLASLLCAAVVVTANELLVLYGLIVGDRSAYGVVGALLALILWMNIVSNVLFLGAELCKVLARPGEAKGTP